jgi:hypothetical protein
VPKFHGTRFYFKAACDMFQRPLIKSGLRVGDGASLIMLFTEIPNRNPFRVWFWTPPRTGQRPSRRVAVTEGNGNVLDKVFHIQAQDTQKCKMGVAENRVSLARINGKTPGS